MPKIDPALLGAIADEPFDAKFSGGDSYSEKPAGSFPMKYKIWNDNPFKPAPEEKHSELIGIHMRRRVKDGEKYKWESERTDKIRAVILFSEPGRTLRNKEGQVVCSSHNGHKPSASIADPKCRALTAADVARQLEKWKRYDAARVTATVEQLTEGSGHLQFCGLAIKSSPEPIVLCPFGRTRKDEITGASIPAVCKGHWFVHAYDMDHSREFQMYLTGKSMYYSDKWMAPIHKFYAWLADQGPVTPDGKKKGVPSYAFVVELTAPKSEKSYYLNVEVIDAISDFHVRSDMKRRAEEAWDKHEASQYAEKKKQGEDAPPGETEKGSSASAQEDVFDEDIPF